MVDPRSNGERPGAPAKVADVTRLAFEGGGVLGVSYVPIVRQLDAWGVLGRVNEWSGTSAGAILAALGALGATAAEIDAELAAAPWEKLAGRRSPIRMMRRCGFRSLEQPRRWLREMVARVGARSGYPPEVTFVQLAERGRLLHVTATDVTRGRPILLGPMGLSGSPVWEAVLASMAIPLWWEPVVVAGGLRLVDGGLTWNMPIDVFDRRRVPPETVLGVRVDTRLEMMADREPPGRWPWDLAARLVSIAVAAANRSHVPRALWPRIVRVIAPPGVKATSFRTVAKHAEALEVAGAAALRRWLGSEGA